MKEILIVRVEPDTTNPKPWKGMSYSAGRIAFHLDVVYHLEDGQTIKSSVSSQKKKDLPRALQRDQTAAANRSFWATFGEDGSFHGTKQAWRIGGGGLVPDPKLADVGLPAGPQMPEGGSLDNFLAPAQLNRE